MPRLLFLIRHAEAVAHAPQGDLERPLTAQGRADAARLGAYCGASSPVPELALVSPARRARDTIEVMLQEFPQKPACAIEDLLYGADIDDFLTLFERIPASVKSLMIVGHNPGLAAFAHFLVDGMASAEVPYLFPAPCLARISLACDAWSEAGGGRLDRLMNFSCVPADDLLSR